MTMPLMIGLTGYAYVGKDTLADLLVRSHGYHRLGFADPLKAMLLALDPAMVRSTDDKVVEVTSVSELLVKYGGSWDKAKPDPYYGTELRRLLQRLGTEAVRNHLGDDAWVRAAASRVNRNGWSRVVIPDVRFPNEAEFVRESGGIVVRIERPGYGPVNAHVSDAGQSQINASLMIFNDGTPEEMLTELERYCR
jgi:hypothetical protein